MGHGETGFAGLGNGRNRTTRISEWRRTTDKAGNHQPWERRINWRGQRRRAGPNTDRRATRTARYTGHARKGQVADFDFSRPGQVRNLGPFQLHGSKIRYQYPHSDHVEAA